MGLKFSTLFKSNKSKVCQILLPYHVVIDYCPDFQVDTIVTAATSLDALNTVIDTEVDREAIKVEVSELTPAQYMLANVYITKHNGDNEYYHLSLKPYNLIL